MPIQFFSKIWILITFLVIFIVGGILAWQYFGVPAKEIKTKSVLCRAQYSASIGGRNEPISDVDIVIKDKSYTTDDYGQVHIPFKIGKEYKIRVSYKEVEKNVQLKYNGETTLFISINPHESTVVDIGFAAVFPGE